MKKKPVSKSAFFNQRFLIGFSFCLIGLVLALLGFNAYPGGKAFARQEQAAAPAVVQQSAAAPEALGIAKNFPVLDLLTPEQVDARDNSLPQAPDQASCSLVVLPTDGSSSANARAPATRFAASRAHYLITAAELAAAGFPNGTTPTFLGWTYFAAPVTGGSAPLTILMQNTTDTTNTKSLTWATAITGMTTVHSAVTALPGTIGPFDIPFTGGSSFTYTGGGLYIAYDWGNYAGTLSTTSSISTNTALINGLASANSAAATVALSNFRPETRLSSFAANNAAVQFVRAFGELPRGLVPAQIVSGVVANHGSSALTNLPVTLNLTGANTFTNGQSIASLASCTGQGIATFSGFTPSTAGANTLTVSVPADDVAGDNALSRPLTVTSVDYSYKHPGTTANGGVGVNGATAALVARFNTLAANAVTAVKLEFPNAVPTTAFRVAIYAESAPGSGTPATAPIFVDAADRPGPAAGPVTITLPAAVPVGPGNFFVGVQQTNNVNVGLSFDTENPIRSGSFFLAIPNGTAFFDAAPGNNFKLNIGLILQTPGPTPTATATATASATSTVAPTSTPSPSVTPATPTPASPTPSPTITPTAAPSASASCAPATATFSNPAAITIPAGAPGVTQGAATPYPSNIAVAGTGGTITKVVVALNNITSTFPNDFDLLLVGPGGQSAVIMSDCGGGGDVTGITITLDDAAAANMTGATLVTGSFKPTNLVGVAPEPDTWPAPAPAPPAGGASALSIFNGTSANGTWNLYVFDDASGDVGSMGGGWSLTITTDSACATPSPTTSPGTPSPSPSATCPPGLTQGFDDITTLPGAGWVQTNHSTTIGTTGWFQGNSAVFPAHLGAPTAYIGANFNNTTGTNTISNWLLTPAQMLQNGATLTFWTRTTTANPFPDRLQVRMSTAGASTNIGTTATELGDFTTLLLDINPTYTVGGYPEVWTQQTVTVTGVPAATLGRLAFRYFVENGGPTGTNSNYIGIDTFAIAGACETPTPSPTVTVTPSPTVTVTPSPTVTVTPSPTVTVTPSPTVTVTPSPTVTVTPSPTVTVTPSPTVTVTPSPTVTVTPSPTVTVTPSATVTVTPSATVTVTPSPTTTVTPTPSPTAPPSQVNNLSTRMRVQIGDRVGIGGFIITGGPKQVLIRAIGPSLTRYMVVDVLADPFLELHGPPGFATQTNDNWRIPNGPAIQATGMPPTNDLESAILATLNPGAYTAIIKGNGGASGVGLVEVYDLNPSSGNLANISTRAFVDTSDNIVIAGFVLGNNSGLDQIMVRGLGPSLICAGVSSILADPTLELRDQNGSLLISNNDWQDNPAQAAIIAASGLAPSNNLEAAIAATLPPGLYTALLAGLSNTTGNGAVEVYDLGSAGAAPSPTPGVTPLPTATPPPCPSPTPTATSTPTATTTATATATVSPTATATATPTATNTPTPTATATATPTIAPTPTPTSSPTTCTENFDGVTAPALPAGWVATNAAGPPTPLWVTSPTIPDTAPNDAVVKDPPDISDKRLDTRNIFITSAAAVLRFRNYFNLQNNLDGVDGGVLEVSSPNIAGGAFTDITDLAVGGSFFAGDYTATISINSTSPLAGRRAWSGVSGGDTSPVYIDTVINLPANLNGQVIKLRFRLGTDDQAAAGGGWRIDTIAITGGSCP